MDQSTEQLIEKLKAQQAHEAKIRRRVIFAVLLGVIFACIVIPAISHSGSSIPEDVTFKIINDDVELRVNEKTGMVYQSSYDYITEKVELNKPISIEILEKIALKLKHKLREYKRIFLWFYLEGYPHEKGDHYWGSVSFTPAISSVILGESINADRQKFPFTQYTNFDAFLKSENYWRPTEGDKYRNADNFLSIVSKDPLQIELDVTDIMHDQTPTDFRNEVNEELVYMALCLFSKTPINDVTITAIPLIVPRGSGDDEGERLYQYQRTITANRNHIPEIITSVNAISLQDLFKLDSGFYAPNSKFLHLCSEPYAENVLKQLQAQ